MDIQISFWIFVWYVMSIISLCTLSNQLSLLWERLPYKMSSFPFRCSLHEIVQNECGSSKGEESHILLSECSSDISSHLVSCHLPKCGAVTECELILARAGTRGFWAAQVAGMTTRPRPQTSSSVIFFCTSCHWQVSWDQIFIGKLLNRLLLAFNWVKEL